MRRRRSPRLAYVLFMLPVVVIAGLVVYQFTFGNQHGTITVEAVSSGTRHSLNVPYEVYNQAGSILHSGTTPSNVSLPQGSYEVAYGTIPWYGQSPSRVVELGAGLTAFAVGELTPTQEVIMFNNSGFNNTVAVALHDVTPVVWVNGSNQTMVLVGQGFSTVTLQPLQNYTHIYSDSGAFEFLAYSTDYTGTVNVS